MGVLQKTVLATTMIGAGVAATSGAAFADTAPVADVSHLQTITPVNLCNNSLDIDLLGTSHGDHGPDHGSCINKVDAWN